MWGWIIGAAVALAVVTARQRALAQTSTAIATETIDDLHLTGGTPRSRFQLPTQLTTPFPGTAGQSMPHSPVSGAPPWPHVDPGIVALGTAAQMTDVAALGPESALWWVTMAPGSVFFLPPQTVPPGPVVAGEGRTWP